MPGGITHGRISDPRLLTPVCAGLYMSPGNSVLSEDCKWNPHLPPRKENLRGRLESQGVRLTDLLVILPAYYTFRLSHIHRRHSARRVVGNPMVSATEIVR